ncbi:MAG TPA: PAS domain S-box protein [Longimicrobium sp.]|nr:PAS domain S-box protein [Longimicrobium sp.]
MLENLADGFAAFDRKWRYTAVNARLERITGRTRAELLGRVVWEATPELAGSRAGRELRRAMEERVTTGCVEHMAAHDRWLDVRAFPLADGAGATVRDVTSARRAEAALRESEERFRSLADTAPVLIWLADTRNRGTYFNRPWLEFTGRTLAEELGFGWVESIHPDDRERAAAYCQAAFDRGQEFRMEFRLRRRDGEYRWVLDHGVPRRDARGEFLGYVGSCIDITDRRRAEEALRLSGERYRTLVEATAQLVGVSDAEGRVSHLAGWSELTGEPAEAVGAWHRSIHPDDRPRAFAAWDRARAARAPLEVEFRIRVKDGGHRWFVARAAPVLDASGEVREWIGTLADVHARRTAQAALRESEERYRLALRATRDVVWDWDLETGRVRWNEAAAEVLGYAPGEMGETADWWTAQIHPDDRARVMEGTRAAIDSRAEGWTAEYRFRRKDGGWADVFDRGYLFRGEDGLPTRMIGAMQDVTERRRAEAARESERQTLRRVLAQLPAALSVHEGPEHVFVAVSDRMVRLMGGREGLLGKPAREAFPELAAQGFADLLDRVYRTGQSYAATAASAMFDADGDGVPEEHLVDFVYQPLTDAAGRVYGVLSVLSDVTERERNAAEVAAARRRVEILAEAGNRLAASLDYRETVGAVARLAVPGLADWCFVEVQDEPGGPIRLLAAGHEDPVKVELAFATLARFPIRPDDPHGTAKVLRTGEPELFPEIPTELPELLSHDDEHRRIVAEVGFRSSLSVPLTAGGRTFGVLSLVQAESGRRFGEDDVPLARELAHRAALALENARLYEEALAGNRAKSGFLATMSHELRTPLNAMIGYVDLLLMGIPAPIPEAARAQVERIRLASTHLLSIIEEILTFSRLEAGRETVEVEEVDLSAVIGEVTAIIEPLAAAQGIAFRVPERVDPPTLRTDPRKLRQILVNLLGNAVKFTREGSVSFEVERADGHVLLHVRDTGIGVDPRFHEMIFEAFRQVDDAKTRSAAGTGLGLAVSRRLARLLGGDVTVSSEAGAGSTFTVRLPESGA